MRKRLWITLVVVSVAGGIAIVSWTGKGPFAKGPTFVRTKQSLRERQKGASLVERVMLFFQRRRNVPVATAFSFPPRPVQMHGIDTLLNQCTDINGVIYVMPRGVAAGLVSFGSSNTMTGDQWVQASLDALQTGMPQWWDAETKQLRTGNLVIVTNDPKTVLVVLPPDMASKYQR